MDFNAIVKKLRDIEPTDIANPDAEAPKADTKAPVMLSEAAQLRIKAGISTVLAESQKVDEAKAGYCSDKCCGSDVKAEDCTCGPGCSHCDCNKVQESVETVEESKVKEVEGKFVNKGAKLEKVKVKNESEEKAKTFDEEIENILESVKSKLVKEAKKKMPDYPDVDGDGNKEEPIEKAQKDKKAKGGDKKKPASKGLSAKQKKLPAGLQKAIANKKGAKTESVVATKKQAVAESMKFLDAIKIVKESNGEMKIDAVDTILWNWAKRVASSKVSEGGLKAEAVAAKIYESRGGIWDVSKKIISE